MSYYRSLSLSSRLILLVIAALIPLIALVVGLHFQERDSRRQAGIAAATTIAQDYAHRLQSGAAAIEGFMDAGAIVIGQEPVLTDDAISPYLASLHERYPNLRAIFVTNPDGLVLASSIPGGASGNTDLSERSYMVALKAGNDKIWSQALAGIETGQLIATFGRTVRGLDGQLRGFLIAAFNPSNLDESVEAIVSPGDNLILIDHAGHVAYNYQRKDTMLQDFSHSPLVQEAMQGRFVAIDDEDTGLSDGRSYGALVPVPAMGWSIGYSKSVSMLNADLRNELIRNLMILALIVVAVLAAMLVMARQITRPLRVLAASASEVGAGGMPVIPAFTNADPDVQQLQVAFQGMSAAVRQREDQLREQAERLRDLEQAGSEIAANLEHEATVQAVTDAGRSLTGADFAAFFYNVTTAEGEEYLLHTLSGLPREAFDGLPQPRNTAIFGPTFRGEAPLRLDDVTQDARYGRMEPYHGMPEGHPPVRSYLAVPVRGVHGGVLGGLFFGHSQPAMFTEHHEALALRLSTWASIALDNARLYREAQEIQEELRRANVAKDEFLGLISHELRTPVTTIYGGLRLLATHRELLEGEQADEFIETMAAEGARLVRLIEDLLALTRIELGKPIDVAPADVNELVSDVVADFERLRQLRPVSVELSDDLPRVALEATYFKQVLNNLLSNSDKYSPEGRPIEVVTHAQNGSVAIVVSDNGPGVDPDEVDKIFESFYRSPKTTPLAPGQGLGLTVCRKLVQAQNGSIWARNRESGGLSVELQFPAIHGTGGEDEPAAAGALPE